MITTNLPPMVLPEKDAAKHVGGQHVLDMLRRDFKLTEAFPARGRQPKLYDRAALEAAWKTYLLTKKTK